MIGTVLGAIPPDLVIIGSMLLTMLVSVGLSYVVGGQIWVDRHSIPIDIGNTHSRISGFWGEAAIVILGGSVFIIVSLMTPAASLTRLIHTYPFTVRCIVGACIVVYAFYARSVVVDCIKKEGHRGRGHWLQLLATYIAYAPYSILLYLSALSVTVALLVEYVIESSHLAVQREAIVQHMRQIAAIHDPEKIQSAIEFSYGNILSTGNQVASSMSPAFMMIAVITFLTIFVTRSPLRSVLLVGSRHVTEYVTIAALTLIFGLTIITYYFSYAELSSQSLHAIMAMRPSLLSGRWEVLERFNEVVGDLERRRSFLGFAGMVVNESGVSVIGVALLQWALGNVKLTKAAKQSHAAPQMNSAPQL
ncbi:MAG: hypothetical protein P4L57_01755 [Rhizomicrobium sp.]|nr:hypothetical protein [Rhizomicrobium sp.]